MKHDASTLPGTPVSRVGNAARFCAAAALAVIMCVLAAPVPAGSQSLGELARQEEARRKAVKKPAKVYTNSSLAPVPGEVIPTPPTPKPETPQPQAAADPVRPTDAAAELVPAPNARNTPDYWRQRLAEAALQRDRNAIMLEALQSRINALLADFTARDDPAQRSVIAGNRQKALEELGRLQKEQVALDKAIADIHEEARREGIPPGWLR